MCMYSNAAGLWGSFGPKASLPNYDMQPQPNYEIAPQGTTSPVEMSPLLALPPELRIQIYEELLCPNPEKVLTLYHDRRGQEAPSICTQSFFARTSRSVLKPRQSCIVIIFSRSI